ncbi:MAG: RNA methyltransferase [Patescibacteria group bacterium]
MNKESRILHLIAHNIRSAQNIGSLLRTCDSLGIGKLWITGYTPTPKHTRVKKTALGAEQSVVWEQVLDVQEAIKHLKSQGYSVAALETGAQSVDLVDYAAPERLALLLGNEVEGVPPSLLSMCDGVVSIKQVGKKESLNVAVATAIAAYWILNTEHKIQSTKH